jgi:serine/threonine protein kinase
MQHASPFKLKEGFSKLKEGFIGARKYMCRVQARDSDPRKWSQQDVADFLQSCTKAEALLAGARQQIDGATLVRDKNLLLAHWASSTDRDQLERISTTVDEMVLDADVRRGNLRIQNARIIRKSDLTLEEPPIDAGSVAEVYRGVWKTQGKEILVAVKAPPSLHISRAGSMLQELQELIREVDFLRVAAASEYVVKYHGVVLGLPGVGPGQRCGIVMDLEFCSLATVLEEGMLRDTRYRLKILLETALGLRGIHRAGIMHGDIKPSNLLLSCDGRIKVADFSHSESISTLHSLELARAGGAGASAGALTGTVHYLSPEAWDGRRSKASDVWAFGLIIWHLLTGLKRPWEVGMDAHQIICRVVHQKAIPALPSLSSLEILAPIASKLAGLYRRCCSFEPDVRPSAGDLASDLEALLEEVRRQDELPPTWSPPAEGQDPYEVRLIGLAAGSEEYAGVERLFFASQCAQYRILSIQRVQNMEQWNLYRQKRQDMAGRPAPPQVVSLPGVLQPTAAPAGANERQLFHGTVCETVPLINQKSFNRSYCGRNATRYGRGTYFACEASYSAHKTYSPPDTLGRRYMYLARVLVGATAAGDRAMVEPPPLPWDPARAYDSTCDSPTRPSLYVVYHDAQAYPEYLISFADK